MLAFELFCDTLELLQSSYRCWLEQSLTLEPPKLTELPLFSRIESDY